MPSYKTVLVFYILTSHSSVLTSPVPTVATTPPVISSGVNDNSASKSQDLRQFPPGYGAPYPPYPCLSTNYCPYLMYPTPPAPNNFYPHPQYIHPRDASHPATGGGQNNQANNNYPQYQYPYPYPGGYPYYGFAPSPYYPNFGYGLPPRPYYPNYGNYPFSYLYNYPYGNGYPYGTYPPVG